MRAKYKALMDQMITNRMAEGEDIRHDLYAVTCRENAQAGNSGESIRFHEIWSEAILLFPAGKYSFYIFILIRRWGSPPRYIYGFISKENHAILEKNL
jgi:hypothetical protein